MLSTEKTLLLCLAVAVAPAALAVTPPTKVTEYSVIHDRNPFGLVDPPPPKVEEPAPAPPKKEEPPPNVQLTGFFRNARKGSTVALFLVERKKGEPKESFMWAVGEGDDGMKVLAINEKDRTVKLAVDGTESTITFEKKPAPAPVAVGKPGAPGQRTPRVPATNNRGNPRAAAPAVQPQQFNNTRSGGFGRSVSTSSAVGGAYNQAASADMLQSIPGRNLRTINAGADQTRMEMLTPREQEVLIEVNREVTRRTGVIQPPLPPTSLTTPEDLRRLIVPPSPGQGGVTPQQ